MSVTNIRTADGEIDIDVLDPTGAQLEEQHDGQIKVHVPRVAVVADLTDPTVLKLTFSGSIELDRSLAADVDFYNRLTAGETHQFQVTDVHVAGAKTTHHRDSEGDVDAVVQTKTLIVTSIDIR